VSAAAEPVALTNRVVPLREAVELNPRPDRAALPDDLEVSFVPMAAVAAASGRIDATAIRRFGEVKKGYTVFREGDVLFAKITPCMENGKMAVARGLHNGVGCGSTEFHVLRPRPGVDPYYVYHFVSSARFRAEAAHHMTGAVGQKRVPAAFLEQCQIPLPDLDEQYRIVAEIEKQFSRLDEAVANLKRVKANLKRYKAAVLQSAVDGRILSTGISANAESPSKWGWATCGDVVESIQAGASFKCVERPPVDGEVGVVKVSAVTWGEFDELESKTCLEPEREKEALFIRPGDFLFSRANTIELVGACVIAQTVTKSLMLSDKILRFRLAPRLDPKWLLICLQSRFGRSEIERLATGNQESMRNIGQDRIRQIRLPLPALTEQRHIVEEVDRRLSIVREVEAEVDASLMRAQVLREAVLERAFSPAESKTLEMSS
jgi:type I restriction enzyme S subunit